MSRYLTILFLLTSLLASLAYNSAQAASYISDEIGVTMRSGPTNRYRVVGKLSAGTPITVLNHNAESKTSEIRTSDGKKTGWIKTEYISSKKTIRALYQETLSENNQLKQSTGNLNQQLANKQAIQQQNDSLQQQVSELENQVSQLTQQADLQKSRFRKDVFYSGALTVLVSMFIAWLITRTAYGRRQRSGWR